MESHSVKPICVIKVDMETDFGNGQKANLNILRELFAKMLNDYHVFVIPAIHNYEIGTELFTFQVFYEKDFTEIQYEELKQLITDSIKQQ
jgi:hypothetical protein